MDLPDGQTHGHGAHPNRGHRVLEDEHGSNAREHALQSTAAAESQSPSQSRLVLPFLSTQPSAPVLEDSTQTRRPLVHSATSTSSSDRTSFNSFGSLTSWTSHRSSVTSPTTLLAVQPKLSSIRSANPGANAPGTSAPSSSDLLRPLTRPYMAAPPGSDHPGTDSLMPPAPVLSPNHSFSASPAPAAPNPDPSGSSSAPASGSGSASVSGAGSGSISVSRLGSGSGLLAPVLSSLTCPGTTPSSRPPNRRFTFSTQVSRRGISASVPPSTRNSHGTDVRLSSRSSHELLSPEGELSQPVYPPLVRPRLSNPAQYCLTDRTRTASYPTRPLHWPVQTIGGPLSRSTGSFIEPEPTGEEDVSRLRLPPLGNITHRRRIRTSSVSQPPITLPVLTPRPLPHPISQPPLPHSQTSPAPRVPSVEEDPLLGMQRLTLNLYGHMHISASPSAPQPPRRPHPSSGQAGDWNSSVPGSFSAPSAAHLTGPWSDPPATLAPPETVASILPAPAPPGASGASDSERDDEYEQPPSGSGTGVKRARRSRNITMLTSASSTSLNSRVGANPKRKLGRPRNVSRERLLTILSAQDGAEGSTPRTPQSGSTRLSPSAAGASGDGANHEPDKLSSSGDKDSNPNSTPGMSVCTYLHPLTGAYCGVVFHRLYDLARHRETIHAKEEAKAIERGHLTMQQALVWGKEVDPSSSSITKEWVCEACDSVFSRKDALLRHRRLRHH